MRIFPLDKVLTTNTDYPLENYKNYVISMLGTADTANVTIRIDGKACGVITNYLCAAHKTGTAMHGLLDLNDLFLVVPGAKIIRLDGTAATLVRVKGRIIDLLPNESLPGDLMARFAAQHNEFITGLIGSAISTGTAWADGAEISLFSLTPTTIERYLLNHRFLVRQAAAGSPVEADGAVGIRIYVDGQPQDNLVSTAGRRGINRFALDIPGTGTNEMAPFDLSATPVEILGDHLLEVKAMNVSGGSLFATTAAQFQLAAAARYRRGP